jgi:hypothetical protein
MQKVKMIFHKNVTLSIADAKRRWSVSEHQSSLARDSSLALLVQNDRAYRLLHIAIFVFGLLKI